MGDSSMKNGFDLVQLTSSLKKVGDFARGKLSSEVETLKRRRKKILIKI